jgi:hypothetical protein
MSRYLFLQVNMPVNDYDLDYFSFIHHSKLYRQLIWNQFILLNGLLKNVCEL